MIQTMTLLMTLSSTIGRRTPIIKNNESLLFDPSGWLYNKHMVVAVQMLYIQKL